MPRVAVIFTGGTISMLPDPLTGAAVPSLDGAAIIARTPGLGDIAELVSVDWGLVPASHLSFDQVLGLARRLEGMLSGAVAGPIDGAVVVQGTDTIEETAFCFDLLVPTERPVVVTGAMRNAGDSEWDGAANLRDAVAVAAGPSAAGQGTLVVIAGRVLPGDDAMKRHASALDAFEAPNVGALGRVDDGVVALEGWRRPRRRLASIPEHAAEPVHLVTATIGMDGAVLRALRATEPRGFVVAATGSGNTHPDLLAAAAEAMESGIPVVHATRCHAGSATGAYGFPGGGRAWLDAGAIPCGSLSAPKARACLALGLGAGLDDAALRALLSDR